MAAITIQNDDHWHSLRAKYIGGTETASLFGESPYLTFFELFHRKIGNIPEPDFSDNNRIFWGKYLEPSIAAGVAEIKGWKVQKCPVYYTNDNCPGHGATLDYDIVDDLSNLGDLEIKTVDFLTFKNEWENEVPPLHYELQFQTQLACSGRNWGAIAVLIGGNDCRIYEYERRPRTIEIIEDAVWKFWDRVRRNQSPDPDFHLDGDALKQLYAQSGGGWVNLTGDVRAELLCKTYLDAMKTEKQFIAAKNAAKAELLTKLGNADKADCGPYKISAGMVKASAVSFTKDAYRQVRISEPKGHKIVGAPDTSF